MFTTNYWGSFAHKAVSIISLFALVVGVFPATATASGSDSCNQQFTYEKSGDFNDSRVTINFYDGDEKVDVSADSGYTLVSVQYDLQGGGQSLLSWSFSGNSTTINPSGSVEVDDIKVVVKKVCPDLCPNISGDQYTVPNGMQVYNGQCVVPPTVTLTGASSCVAANGTYSITWTLTNNASDRQMQITDRDFDGDDNLTGNSFNEGVTDPTFSPSTIAANGNATAVTNHDISNGNDTVQRVRAEIDVRWQSSPSDTGTFEGASDEVMTVTNYGTPCVPPPPTDLCPNVNGIQTATPCADTTCVAEGGTWNNNQCTIPTTNVCHKTGNDWEQKAVNNNALSGHLGHGDFVIDAQHPCPPVAEEPEPTEEQVCETAGNSWIEGDCYTPEAECEVIDEGFWTGSDCDDIEQCGQGQTYNSSNNACTDPEPTEAEACVLGGDFWTGSACVDIAVCTGSQSYNVETNTCVDQDTPPTCTEHQTLVENQCVDNEITPTPEPEAPKKKSKGLSKACGNNVDDDNDGLYDMNDPDCESTSDTSEAPAIGGTSEGDVLGACSAIIDSYIGLSGIMAAPEAVKVLQAFLNKELGLSLEVDGEYDAATVEAVKAFQAKYSSDVLSPWGITDSTGIVYKTTQRMINKIACPTLDIPMPELN